MDENQEQPQQPQQEPQQAAPAPVEPAPAEPKAKQPETLDELAARLKLEPWKLAAVKAKHKLASNSEVSESELQGLVADVESIQVNVPPEKR